MGKQQTKPHLVIPIRAPEFPVASWLWQRLGGLLMGGICLFMLMILLNHQNANNTNYLAGEGPYISDVYIINKHRILGRQTERGSDLGAELCRWLGQKGGEVLGRASCTPFAGFSASASTREEILDLIDRRIVAPDRHAKRQGPLTRLLYRLGFSASSQPLLNEREEVIDAQSLSYAASHALAWQNWTMTMFKAGVRPAERARRLLLVLEDDVNMTADTVAALQRVLPRLDPFFDILALDSSERFCSLHCLLDRALVALRLRTAVVSPQLVRARTSFDHAGGMVLSYKGAMQLFRYLPITRTPDMWQRDLVTDQILKVYVACPRIV